MIGLALMTHVFRKWPIIARDSLKPLNPLI